MYFVWQGLMRLVHGITGSYRIQTLVAVILVGGQCALAFLLSYLFPAAGFYIFLATVLLLFEFILETLIRMNVYGKYQGEIHTLRSGRDSTHSDSYLLYNHIRGVTDDFDWEGATRGVPFEQRQVPESTSGSVRPTVKVAGRAGTFVHSLPGFVDAVTGELLSVVFFVLNFSALLMYWNVSFGGFAAANTDVFEWLRYCVSWVMDDLTFNLSQIYGWDVVPITPANDATRILIWAFNLAMSTIVLVLVVRSWQLSSNRLKKKLGLAR